MKTVCLGILRRVSSKNRILPEWYHLPQETSSDDLPQPYGYFADVRKGRLDEDQVRVKVFRATTMEFPVVFERVCDCVSTGCEHSLTTISGSTMRSWCGST